MTSNQESVSDFKSSMSFLIDSMLETLTFVSRGRIMLGKQPYHVQTEKFSSFFDKVSEDETLLQNLQSKVVVPLFNTHSMSFLNPLVGADGKVSDEFLKCQKKDDDTSEFKIKTAPEGLYFQISKVFLPVSEVYTEAVRISVERKGDNLPFPKKILLGLYSVIFHAIREETSGDQLEMINENRKVLAESLESCDDAPQRTQDSGPMGMIKNLLGNIDFNQIGEMMQKVSGDENSSKEFGEVFGKISETIKDGGNPLDAMGDIIKQVSMQAAEEEESTAVVEEESTAAEEEESTAAEEEESTAAEEEESTAASVQE
jgi:hypothetical protein